MNTGGKSFENPSAIKSKVSRKNACNQERRNLYFTDMTGNLGTPTPSRFADLFRTYFYRHSNSYHLV